MAAMIHENLKEFLEHTRTTEKELAKKLGISIAYVSMLRRGQRRPSARLAQKIETLTGIPFRQLLLGNEASKVRRIS